MDEIEVFLTGRIWLREHTPFPADEIDALILSGKIKVIPGITDKQCARCLEKNTRHIVKFRCARCQADCLYCRHCLTMGRVSSCTELITWADPSLSPSCVHSFAWNGTLTSPQKQASDELLASLERNEDHLIYAVCGAGKTELLFPPIYAALLKNKRVCLAAPRTDVVLELAPRLKEAFPGTVIHTLYGDAPKETGFAQLVIATTHQLYRFQEAFGFMIVDEADAFPYSADQALQYAVQKAKKPDAPVAYVTATPSNAMLRSVRNQSRIFRRYHGHPLPESEYRSLWNYRKAFRRKTIPPKLKSWLEEKLRNRQPFLLFLPTIELIEETIPLFQALDPRIQAVYAEDPDRKQKVLQLRNQEVPGLVTSTILERGITIPNVQVAVVGADEAIFTAAALIQIAGRAGRSAEQPTGDVLFFHNGISRKMDSARRLIRLYNTEGFS
ncbi:DEAD/DEAH box helicase [Planococcus lenghuensis]|uniref:DNA/RNA helicase n=1 Tax=Planococcus lenghuensis TaxID=2213202 RepID=A0A1Q2L0H6_9BACL|nr:DEAD/DEAH box helicase [Planococcus lenghuensis]AQQ53948.1 DNA/RNA helicase [Planococcus lenghuensis]